MKKLIILFWMLTLLAISVNAIEGGENHTLLHIDKCINITVIVDGNETIDAGEYSLVDCNETNISNIWFCDCNGSTDLILQTQPNTINTYNFTIDYVYQYTAPPSGGGGGGTPSGGGGTHYYYNTTNESYINPALIFVRPIQERVSNEPVKIGIVENNTIIEEPVVKKEPTKVKVINETVVEPVVKSKNEVEVDGLPIVFIVGVLVMLLGALGLILWFVFFREKDDSNARPRANVSVNENVDNEYESMIKKLDEEGK